MPMMSNEDLIAALRAPDEARERRKAQLVRARAAKAEKARQRKEVEAYREAQGPSMAAKILALELQVEALKLTISHLNAELDAAYKARHDAEIAQGAVEER